MVAQRELVYFLAIAKEGNISKAAESLFVAQPSLSRCLQKLETDLGVKLFKRTIDGLKPTVAGEYYIECAESILRINKEMENQISRLNKLKVGRLTIGTTTFLGSFVMPDILKFFHSKYPGIQVSIVEDVSLGIENSIMRGEVDLGILHTPLVNKHITVKKLVSERFFLAVPPDDPLNQMSYDRDGNGEMYIDIGLFADREFILTHPEQRTRQVTDKILARAGIRPRIKFLTKSIQTASRLANIGMGLTLVPHCYRSVFSSSYSPSYYFIAPELKPYWDLVVCHSPDIPLSRATEEMIRICTDIIPGLYIEQNI
ncbi:MAG: LysR family transcriptional regulator [Desulfitobacteriaceae bacterium]|nr:LysR family transcriptional regulator [Desulfitobacteriaceae bacterium]